MVRNSTHSALTTTKKFIQPAEVNAWREPAAKLQGLFKNLRAIQGGHGVGSAAVFVMFACDDAESATLRAAATVIAVVTRLVETIMQHSSKAIPRICQTRSSTSYMVFNFGNRFGCGASWRHGGQYEPVHAAAGHPESRW